MSALSSLSTFSALPALYFLVLSCILLYCLAPPYHYWIIRRWYLYKTPLPSLYLDSQNKYNTGRSSPNRVSDNKIKINILILRRGDLSHFHLHLTRPSSQLLMLQILRRQCCQISTCAAVTQESWDKAQQKPALQVKSPERFFCFLWPFFKPFFCFHKEIRGLWPRLPWCMESPNKLEYQHQTKKTNRFPEA